MNALQLVTKARQEGWSIPCAASKTKGLHPNHELKACDLRGCKCDCHSEAK